jgi:DNA-binding PadR family transcriptional regulator
MKSGLVEESDRKVDPRMDDKRRITYRLTPNGRQTLKSELERMDRAVDLARKKRFAWRRLGIADA